LSKQQLLKRTVDENLLTIFFLATNKAFYLWLEFALKEDLNYFLCMDFDKWKVNCVGWSFFSGDFANKFLMVNWLKSAYLWEAYRLDLTGRPFNRRFSNFFVNCSSWDFWRGLESNLSIGVETALRVGFSMANVQFSLF
jgi:hypothetical protein